MPAIIVYQGSMNAVDAWTARNTGFNRVGLFQNDLVVRPWHTLANLVPCNFSGYTGPLSLGGWTPAAMEGDQAVSRAAECIWTHNGGPVANYVFGYYIVSAAGELLLAERDPDAPVLVAVGGVLFRCVPTYTSRSRFGNE